MRTGRKMAIITPFTDMISFFILTMTILMKVSGQTSVSDASSSAATTTDADSCYCLHKVADKLHGPVGAIFYKEGQKENMLVVEQRGVVIRYEIDEESSSTAVRVETFMDIRDRVVTSGDYGESRGLLSVVMDPFFDVTKKVFAYYIRNDTGDEYAYISMFRTVDGVVDPNSETYLLRIYQPFKHGNGGPMFFGDDSYLYIVTGDGGEEDDPHDNAQNKNTFHGKVLRIDVDGKQDFTDGQSGVAKSYAIPESNPFVKMNDAKPEVYASGIRNMWGCSIDTVKRTGGTGRIFCAETGTGRFDEINIIQSGRDYGWNDKEGSECRNASGCPIIENEGLPIYEFAHNSTHSLVGGYVYRGDAMTWMKGKGYYTYGDVMTGKTYILEETSPDVWKNHKLNMCEISKCPSSAKGTPLKHAMAFSQDLNGELYLLMTDMLIPTRDAGTMFKMVPPKSSSIRTLPQTALMTLCAVLWISFRHF